MQISSTIRRKFRVFIDMSSVTEATCSEFMEKVNDGSHRVKTSGWPKFLYDLEATPYDPNNKDRGLLRGALLVRVCVLLSILHQLI